MELETLSSQSDLLCKLCNEKERRYVCPKCNIDYCSLECYKSTGHLECSEAFYKQCVEEELKEQQSDPQMRQKTLEMLQRVYDNDLDDFLQEEENDISDEANLDSDDENIPSLSSRLENINLDDADKIWSVLTPSERQKFEALIQSGEASKLVPSWDPWWNYYAQKKLVKEVTEKSEDQKYKSNCPKILDIPVLESVSKASPFIKYSIINTVYAYAYSILHFIGEHHSTPLNTVYVFLRLCETMRVNRVFKDSLSATENVLLEIANCEALIGYQETILGTKEAGDAILNGPDDENKSFYICAALSDLYELIQKAKKEISDQKIKSETGEFKNKFHSKIDLGSIEVTKKSLSLLLKKIEFFVAWLKSKGPTYNINVEEKV